MSLQFSDTINRKGIIQKIEKNCGFDFGDISGNAGLLADFTADVNMALDAIWGIIGQSCGTWSLDDTNYTDYPFIVANLVSGQRDYPFLVDGDGNLILDVFRVMVADPTATFHEIYPVDQKTTTSHTGNVPNTDSFINGLNATGTPTRYDKTGNSVFLDVIPNYNMNGGIQMFVNREASYFLTSDTIKKPGFSGLYHEYLALRPSYQYASVKGFANAMDLKNQMDILAAQCSQYYSNREKDAPKRLVANVENNK